MTTETVMVTGLGPLNCSCLINPGWGRTGIETIDGSDKLMLQQIGFTSNAEGQFTCSMQSDHQLGF